MSEEMKALLSDLADVIERHNAGLGYTTDDDGIHVMIGGWGNESVCIGFPQSGSAYYIRSMIASSKP